MTSSLCLWRRQFVYDVITESRASPVPYFEVTTKRSKALTLSERTELIISSGLATLDNNQVWKIMSSSDIHSLLILATKIRQIPVIYLDCLLWILTMQVGDRWSHDQNSSGPCIFIIWHEMEWLCDVNLTSYADIALWICCDLYMIKMLANEGLRHLPSGDPTEFEMHQPGDYLWTAKEWILCVLRVS